MEDNEISKRVSNLPKVTKDVVKLKFSLRLTQDLPSQTLMSSLPPPLYILPSMQTTGLGERIMGGTQIRLGHSKKAFLRKGHLKSILRDKWTFARS